MASILLAATMNGVFLLLRMFIDSTVCGSTPLVTSTTSIAMSAADPPLLLQGIEAVSLERELLQGAGLLPVDD